MSRFEFHCRTRFICGAGVLQSLGELASEMGARRALLVTDPGIIAAGHASRAEQRLRDAGIEVTRFEEVHENPTTHDVEQGCRVARRCEPECLIAVGGGSSMDCAKGINFVYTNGGTMRDYWGVGKALRPMLPMIAVPTTAGTGSEAQSFALISDAETHVKMACGDKKAACRIALLDPELTLTQPPRVTAVTGIDAIAHAIETFVTTKRTVCSQMLSREAWRNLASSLPRLFDTPSDLEARATMQWGACLAGMAIENSMLGGAHALANPLTATYDIVHGQAVAVMLPHIVRHNTVTHQADYAELWQIYSEQTGTSVPGGEEALSNGGAEALVQWLRSIVARSGLAVTLRELHVESERLDELAERATAQWTGQFNPRPLTQDDYRQLYQAAM